MEECFSHEFQSMMYDEYVFIAPQHVCIYHGQSWIDWGFLWFFTPVKLLVQFITEECNQTVSLVLLLTWMVLGMFTDLLGQNTYIILGFCIVHIRTYSFDDISIYRRNERNEKICFINYVFYENINSLFRFICFSCFKLIRCRCENIS